ncbi:MAG: S9 family peptidase [Prevotellaceae bacterium]|jgi:dipeptidyl-peptidase-4|nr:S9 family peptidase [Prevotellaceae bacterium]
MTFPSKIIRLTLAFLAAALPALYVQAQRLPLAPEQIFSLQRSDSPPEIVTWTSDSAFVLMANNSYFLFEIEDKTEKKLRIELLRNDDERIHLSDASKKISTERADALLDAETNADAAIRNPQLSPDGKYLAYTRNNDLYSLRLADSREFRLTADGNDSILNGYASWVYMEEILGRATNSKAFWWAPDGSYIAFFRSDDSRVPKFSITDSRGTHGYIETMRYPKAGDPVPEVRIGFADPEAARTPVFADFDPNTDQYFGAPVWRPSAKNLLVQCLNRAQNVYDIFEVSPESGMKQRLYRETSTTWINMEGDANIRPLADNRIIILSERSGYPHLYLLDPNGGDPYPITAGEYSVTEVTEIDEPSETVYFSCLKDNLACRDFYRVAFDGTRLQRLSPGTNTHRVSLSPNAKYFVASYSDVDAPDKADLLDTDGNFIAQVFDTRIPENENYIWPETRFVAVDSDDGRYRLPVRLVLPPNFSPDRKYPLLLNVYGGPASMSVDREWDGNARLANWFAHEDLLQATVDHRGSLHFGRIGQNEMHRNLGEVEVKDYAACVRHLVENFGADPERICISGFSYGGYISCFAMTAAPDVFTHAIAGGSVTDWTLYDATYTERYMDTPAENPEGYRRSSVIAAAGKLKGKLLLTHGLLDENVHVQNTFALASELQDKNRFFDLMIYPSSRHGYRGAKSVHFRNLRTRFIYEHLLRKPVPELLLRELKMN